MKADTLRPELKKKIEDWLISFYHLDPRYQILKFFNLVAAEGADNMLDTTEDDEWAGDYATDINDEPATPTRLKSSTERMLSSIFNTTSILTVWRPCSNDAMRKMMEGSGVGKGLDIKGKSAKKGLLSAFVPFMQIHEDKDKAKIQKISKNYRMRVYFRSAEARTQIIKKLESFAEEFNEKTPKHDDQIANYMKVLDKYVDRGSYGLELTQRLFWKGLVEGVDISRGPDTETGRPSMPGFQDANLKTLKVACSTNPPPSPYPVVLQLHPDDPTSVQQLVIAYEENGTVTPVVSDFDGFLLGWRREAIWFGCSLPIQQEQLMVWCIQEIEKILDSPATADTWTIRWLDVLKEEAKNGNDNIPPTPEYGFGDPKSYSIMEAAAKRLIATGAVRHGSECFNYGFPQEIDDYFLLISDTFAPVPWKYVDVHELQEILIQKVERGFVFPLNPKWILCDPGWMKVYDALMASDALYADMSRDVWFPPYSGIRESIKDIHKRHPNGFQLGQGRVSFEAKKGYSPLRANLTRGVALSGNACFDLAELELENYTSRKYALARQIQEVNMDTLPEEDEDTEQFHQSISERRQMFQQQRKGSNNASANGDNGVNGEESGGNESDGDNDPFSESSRRKMFSKTKGSLHKETPRRNLSSIN